MVVAGDGMHSSEHDLAGTEGPSVEAFTVKDVQFRYSHHDGGPDRVSRPWTLNHLNFQIHQGEVFAVVGPNGSGKSSLLKILGGILKPHEGEVRCFGESLAAMSYVAVARRMAFVPQESPHLFPYTLAETVLMGRFPHHHHRWNLSGLGWETKQDRRVAEQALHDLDLGLLAHRCITEVSGGERQRALIARALAQEPDMLLLDEPTAFLDVKHQLEICRMLRRQNLERGLTIVLVSHDLNLASQYSDRILLLRDGEVYELGTPQEVIRGEVLEQVYGCSVLVDPHPESGLPRVTLPGRTE